MQVNIVEPGLPFLAEPCQGQVKGIRWLHKGELSGNYHLQEGSQALQLMVDEIPSAASHQNPVYPIQQVPSLDLHLEIKMFFHLHLD